MNLRPWCECRTMDGDPCMECRVRSRRIRGSVLKRVYTTAVWYGRCTCSDFPCLNFLDQTIVAYFCQSTDLKGKFECQIKQTIWQCRPILYGRAAESAASGLAAQCQNLRCEGVKSEKHRKKTQSERAKSKIVVEQCLLGSIDKLSKGLRNVLLMAVLFFAILHSVWAGS